MLGVIGRLGSGNNDRILVRTIDITAPQQPQMIGARGFIHASAEVGTNLSNQCSKVIKRLQFGCRKPKLRARRNPLGSTCCNTSQRKKIVADPFDFLISL